MKTKKNLDRQQPIKTCGNCGSYVDGKMSSDGYCDLCRNVGKTKTEHTPGPWSVHGDKPLYIASNGIGCITVIEYITNNAETMANARLIAAAPELLEMLKEARADIAFLRDGDEGVDRLLAEYDRVIAKAEGGK